MKISGNDETCLCLMPLGKDQGSAAGTNASCGRTGMANHRAIDIEDYLSSQELECSALAEALFA